MRAEPDELGPLHGVPVSVKDLTDTAGVRTTYGSEHYADHIPEHDTVAWSRLKAAGSILIGKTTTPEFGWLAVTESRLSGVTGNPWNPRRTAGGSSGGAAAAVASGIGALAMGSDGAGSIRIPAAFCGVVGLKPSLGRVPIAGEDLIYASTEAVGPLTRTVADAALMLTVLQGADERDPFTLPDRPSFDLSCASLAGLRVAFAPNLGGFPVDVAVAEAVASAALALERELGAVVEVVDVDMIDPLQHLNDFWGPATAAFLDDLQADRGADLSLCDPGLLALAARGREMTGVQQWHATVVQRGQIHAAIARVFDDSDILITPTAPLTAFPHPGPVGGPEVVAGRSVADRSSGFVPFTAPFNMTGHPAVSVPCGFDDDGLPIGVQIVGRHNADALVLSVAAAFERVRPWPAIPEGVTK